MMPFKGYGYEQQKVKRMHIHSILEI